MCISFGSGDDPVLIATFLTFSFTLDATPSWNLYIFVFDCAHYYSHGKVCHRLRNHDTASLGHVLFERVSQIIRMNRRSNHSSCSLRTSYDLLSLLSRSLVRSFAHTTTLHSRIARYKIVLSSSVMAPVVVSCSLTSSSSWMHWFDGVSRSPLFVACPC